MQNQIVAQIRENLAPKQATLPEFDSLKDIIRHTKNASQAFCDLSIDIPRIIVAPSGDVETGYREFDLEHPTSRFQPVEQEILVQSLEDESRWSLKAYSLSEQRRLED